MDESQQPLFPTRSTAEAMKLLKETRGHLIAAGRSVAMRLATSHGTVNSREVHDEMAKLGLLEDGVVDHWLGAVFRTPDFVWTGEMHMPQHALSGNTHAWKHVKVWRLRNGKHAPCRDQQAATIILNDMEQAAMRWLEECANAADAFAEDKVLLALFARLGVSS